MRLSINKQGDARWQTNRIHDQNDVRMASHSERPHKDSQVFLPKTLQIVAAVPSLLVWGFLSTLATIWIGAVTVQLLLGTLTHPSDGRFAYIIVFLLLVLACAWPVAKTFWRAYHGRSPLWWHACTLGLGVLFTVLLGIVGD